MRLTEDEKALRDGFGRRGCPYTQRVPEEKREAFIAQVVDRYLENHPPDEQGLVHVKMVRLEVEALKL